MESDDDQKYAVPSIDRFDEYIVCFHRDMHIAEFELKERLESGLSISMAVLAALAGVLWFYVQTLKEIPRANWGCIFLLTCIVLGCLLCGGAICFAGTMWRNAYKHLGWPSQYKRRWANLRKEEVAHYQELVQYYEANCNQFESIRHPSPEDVEKKMLRRLRNHLIDAYTITADRNRTINITKSKFRHGLTICLAASLIVFVLSLVPFLTLFLSN